MYKILLIDDDIEVLELNRKFFLRNKCQVEICSDALKAMDIIKSFMPECILLDVMMPKIDGFTLCKQIRKITNAPILFLSGKVSEDDKIRGFQCGADDYIEKPYSIKEVYIRVIANIRRSNAIMESAKNSNIIEIYPLSIDLESRKVLFNDEEINLANREYDILLYMAKRPNELITYEDIGQSVWGTYCQDDKKTVMVNVSRIRKKLLDCTGMDNIIETVWSKGYTLNAK